MEIAGKKGKAQEGRQGKGGNIGCKLQKGGNQTSALCDPKKTPKALCVGGEVQRDFLTTRGKKEGGLPEKLIHEEKKGRTWAAIRSLQEEERRQDR